MQRFAAGGSQERAGDCGEKPRPGRDEKEKPNGDTWMIYVLLLKNDNDLYYHDNDLYHYDIDDFRIHTKFARKT